MALHIETESVDSLLRILYNTRGPCCLSSLCGVVLKVLYFVQFMRCGFCSPCYSFVVDIISFRWFSTSAMFDLSKSQCRFSHGFVSGLSDSRKF